MRITTNAAGVRAWLEAHADTCVQEKSLVLRRLVDGGAADEAAAEPPQHPAPPEPPDGSEGPDEEDGPEDDE